MRQGEVVARDDQGGFPFPWFGVAFSVLVSILMLGVTVALWSDLPRMIPSGRSGMDGEPSPTPRRLFATAAPGVALTTALCVAIGPAIGSRAHPAPGRFSLSGRSVRVLMDFLLVLINVFLLALHTVVLTSEVRKSLVASVELLTPLLVGDSWRDSVC